MEHFSYGNVLEAPRVQKVVVNMGVGSAVRDSKKIESAVAEMAAITGQKPIVTRAKKANASFKLSRSYSLKSTMIQSMKCGAWILSL